MAFVSGNALLAGLVRPILSLIPRACLKCLVSFVTRVRLKERAWAQIKASKHQLRALGFEASADSPEAGGRDRVERQDFE
jgi:hypothetical protein